MNEKNNRPNELKAFKVFGVIGIILGVFGMFLSLMGLNDFNQGTLMIGGFLTTFGFFIGIPALIIGFLPEISRFTTKTRKYIQQENKEDLQDIANNKSEIVSGAATNLTKAIKKGIKDNKFCQNCGAEISIEAKYCSECGAQQEKQLNS